MAIEIHLAGVRTELTPRREPYWSAPIQKGCFLGFRKQSQETGTWIARCRTNGKQHYQAIASIETTTFDQAIEKAIIWFSEKKVGALGQIDKLATEFGVSMAIPKGKTTWPMRCGCYILFLNESCVYVGSSSTNVFNRLQIHFRRFNFDSFIFLTCSKETLLATEYLLIAKLKPTYNRSGNSPTTVRHN